MFTGPSQEIETDTGVFVTCGQVRPFAAFFSTQTRTTEMEKEIGQEV